MHPLFKVLMAPETGDAVKETLYSGYVGQGEKVQEFEDLLEKTFGWQYTLTTNSCTSALQLALHLIKSYEDWGGQVNYQRTEVLLPPLSCFATTSSVLAAGLKPSWVDIDPETLCMDLDDLERKLSRHTKAVMVVHYAGMPVNLFKLDIILDKHQERYGYRPFVIEDCAQALGSLIGGKFLGTRSNNIKCFSFQAVKFLTTGDGGAIVLPNKELYERARDLRWYGLDRDTHIRGQDIEESGFKYHMNDIAATMGIANLNYICEHKLMTKQMQRYLQCVEELEAVPGIKVPYALPTVAAYSILPWPCTNQLPLIVEGDVDSFELRLQTEYQIDCDAAHYRCDTHKCVKDYRSNSPLTGMDYVEMTLTMVPIGWWLSDSEFEYVIQAVKGEYTDKCDWAKEGF